MVRTMFTDREGRIILDQGTDREGRVRPTASARAHRAQRELRGQRRLQNQQVEHAQPEQGQAEEAQADEAQPEADDGYPGGPVDRSVLRTYGDHVATRLWDGVVNF